MKGKDKTTVTINVKTLEYLHAVAYWGQPLDDLIWKALDCYTGVKGDKKTKRRFSKNGRKPSK